MGMAALHRGANDNYRDLYVHSSKRNEQRGDKLHVRAAVYGNSRLPVYIIDQDKNT